MGRRPKFSNEEILKERCRAYFDNCIQKEEIPSKPGMRVFLDITRETYSQYKKKFPDTIKKAENLIETAWVEKLRSNSPTGAIFYLKNAFKEDYKDRYATDLTSGGKPIPLYDYTIRPNHRRKKDKPSQKED